MNKKMTKKNAKEISVAIESILGDEVSYIFSVIDEKSGKINSQYMRVSPEMLMAVAACYTEDAANTTGTPVLLVHAMIGATLTPDN